MMLGEQEISDEEVNAIKVLRGPRRSMRIKSLLTKYEESLRQEIKDEADEEKKIELEEEVDKKIKQHKLLLNSHFDATRNRDSPTARRYLDPLMEMQLYANGKKISEEELEIEIKGTIEVRNPKPENLKNAEVLAAYESEFTPKGFKTNYDKIAESIQDAEEAATSAAEVLNKPFPINKYLGALDVSKKTVRIKTYDYWYDIGELYGQFHEDLVAFFLSIEESALLPENKEAFAKLYAGLEDRNLEYIVKFEDVTDFEPLEARHRFFNIVNVAMLADGLGEENRQGSDYKDETIFGDEAARMADEMISSVHGGGSSTKGDNIDLNIEVSSEEWTNDLTKLKEAADPLLIYESNRGTKLIGITQTMEDELLEILEEYSDAIQSYDDDDVAIELSLNTQNNIIRWISEVEDTSILEKGDLKGHMALPISVLRNTAFNKIYKDATFPTSWTADGTNGQVVEIGIEREDDIKDFFEDLYHLLKQGNFQMGVQNRSTKGDNSRGGQPSQLDRKNTNFDVGSSKMPAKETQRGKLTPSLEATKSVEGELNKMLTSAIEYYFDPMYSGNMPIQIPRFSSSIGSKVMQTLALDLNIKTTMSKTYDTLFRLSAKAIHADSLMHIADFLEQIFIPSVDITYSLISKGQLAARALTKIFGRKNSNNQYCAALIYHYMVDLDDYSKAHGGKSGTRKFNRSGKTISELAKDFDKSYDGKKSFPMFALPYWLDRNQGILTKDDGKLKSQYDRLKDIFESVQTDLPVLLHKLLKAHDAVRKELGKEVIHGYIPLNTYGINKMITKMQVDEDIDMSNLEIDNIIKAVDSHDNISREYGISSEQVYMIKAHFR